MRDSTVIIYLNNPQTEWLKEGRVNEHSGAKYYFSNPALKQEVDQERAFGALRAEEFPWLTRLLSYA